MTQIGGMELRWMIRRDLPQVLHIESESFRRPWSEEEFLRQLRQRNAIGMVATDGSDEVYGFMIYALSRQELHLLNLAVAVPYRLQGIGRTLFEKLRGKLSLQRRDRIVASVEEYNVPAQLFLRRCGCRAVRVLRNHFAPPDDHVDAYVFEVGVRSEEVAS